MATTFKRAPKEIKDKLEAVITAHHADLSAVGVTIDILLAFAAENEQGEKVGPALKLHGYPASGVASIVSLKNRVMGRSDGEILLDGDSWEKLTSEQQDALLDHEASHFSVTRNLEGEPVLDTHGRPKLKMRLHDWQMGFFNAVATRHGEASPEVQHATQFAKEVGQIYFQGQFNLGDARKPKKPRALKNKPNEDPG